MEAYLRARGLFDTPAGAAARTATLLRLVAVVRGWVQQVGGEGAGGKVQTFGSYRLGVHGPGSDVDTLCVAPAGVTRADFFASLPAALRAARVTELTAVPGAFVPILKIVYEGVAIDLIFAQLQLPSVPADLDLQDNRWLQNIDEVSVRSLNGARTTDVILRLVPHLECYRTALVAVKHWSKARCINSNALGYLGGINLAIMLARAAQLYPAVTDAGVLVEKMFFVFSKWPFPKPVMLCPVVDAGLGLRQWGMHDRDARDLMPLLTPAYPSMNSAYNVTATTFKLLKAEWERGLRICASSSSPHRWAELCEPFNFFDAFKHFLEVSFTTHGDCKWEGYVRAKLRTFIMKLQEVPHVECRPYTACMELPGGAAAACYIGLRFSIPAGAGSTVNLAEPVKNFKAFMHSWPEREPSQDLDIKHLRKSDLPKDLIKRD